MERAELSEGLKAFRALTKGMEAIAKDPAAIQRMRDRAEARPEIAIGPSVGEYLGLESNGDTVGGFEDDTPMGDDD